jgi:outer membrane protein TolC
MKNKIIAFFLLAAGLPQGAVAQRLLSLDSCRAMALRNNKQLSISRVKQEVAANVRKSARTKYLPHVSALGGYEWTSKEISLLSDEQKETLSNLGTSLAGGIGGKMGELMSQVPEGTWQMLNAMGITQEGIATNLGQLAAGLGSSLNGVGQGIVDAFHTDTRNMFAGAVMVTQPVFMGGAIIAMNKMADLGEELACNSAEQTRQQTLYSIDQTYWQVVSLRHKQKLAEGYLDLVKKLDDDVQKMIQEGVATRSEGLSVSVKVNEAEMMLTKVNDGLVLSKMLLCQLCGMPIDEQIVLADEENETLDAVEIMPQMEVGQALENRPELRQLQNMVDMSKQLTNILKAGNLPQVMLMGGYMVSNPNLFNSFQRKFGGMWNVGVMVRVPIWNWGDVAYKVRASKGATTIARLKMDDAREKITLQVNQSNFQVQEANKKLEMAKVNIQKADENLRTANLGFREGVISSTTVMEAQTAWLQAQSQKIDAEIDVKLSQVNLQKALGTLE